MSNNRLRFDGLAELLEELRRLPDDLRDDAGVIVTDTGEGAMSDIIAGYPERTGELRRKVSMRVASTGPFGAAVVIKNTAKHAHLFENGTQARHTDLGADRGSMPPGHVFVPIMIRRRRQMYDELKDMLVQHGLVVSGDF